jgi:hypothetical protein
MPVTHVVVRLESAGDDASPETLMTIVTTFASLTDLEQVSSMGVEEGLRAAVGQIDDVLLELTAAR